MKDTTRKHIDVKSVVYLKNIRAIKEDKVRRTEFEGEYTLTKNKKVKCICGSDRFSAVSHMDLRDFAVTEYKCDSCGKVLIRRDYKDITW